DVFSLPPANIRLPNQRARTTPIPPCPQRIPDPASLPPVLAVRVSGEVSYDRAPPDRRHPPTPWSARPRGQGLVGVVSPGGAERIPAPPGRSNHSLQMKTWSAADRSVILSMAPAKNQSRPG